MRNLTQLAPSLDDLVHLPARLSEQAKAFVYHFGLDDIFGRLKGSGAYLIAENTANRSNISASLTKKALAKETLSSVASSLAGVAAGASPGVGISGAAAITGGVAAGFEQGVVEGGLARLFSMTWQAWKGLGGVLPYVMSKWAFVTLLMSFLVNRTQFYASSRVPLTMWWPVRLGLYLLPIMAVSVQIQWLIQGLRCQTSPDFAMLRYGNESAVYGLDHAGEGGLLHGLSSALLFWETDNQSCMSVQMSNSVDQPSGSLALLWPLFLSLCLGGFADTLSSALQGRQPLSDFNLLELSFAFNEAESMVVRVFDSAYSMAVQEGWPETWDRKRILNRMNTSPDMLLITAIWAASSLTSMLMGVFGRRRQYRLLNTGFWGVLYFAAISRSIFQMWSALPEAELLWSGRIPMILLMGFIPHLIVVVGMLVCAFVYGSALILTAFSLPPAAGAPTTFREKLSLAYQNLQANVHFSNSTPLSFKMTDDFYTALLNAGFTILTAASEAVYLNEGAKVRISHLTWVERKRIQELQQGLLFKKTRAAIPSELRAAINDRVETVVGNPQPSGYAIERKIRGQNKEEALAAVKGDTGLPIVERSGRFGMALRLVAGTFWLILGFNAKFLLITLELCGITWRPPILDRIVGAPKKNSSLHGSSRLFQKRRLDLIVFPNGDISHVGSDTAVDVEGEFRRHDVPDVEMDERLYDWWKQGGFWGEVDGSGEYLPTQRDDDTTSMVSMSTNHSTANEDEWEDDLPSSSGRRTPTQRNPFPSSRESTPFEYDGAFSTEQLATLLDPKDANEQHEARLLARRLRNDGVVTRSKYNRELLTERAALLSSSRYGQRLTLDSTGAPLSAEDEEAALETFILSRRHTQHDTAPVNDDWASGANGMGSAGPQCVVCQDSPRTILLWPCGCLCLCDECRVSMAARNFNTCVCCRTGTLAYSRLYVP